MFFQILQIYSQKWSQECHFKFHGGENFQGMSLSEATYFFYNNSTGNDLAIRHGFPDITNIKVNNDHKYAI